MDDSHIYYVKIFTLACCLNNACSPDISIPCLLDLTNKEIIEKLLGAEELASNHPRIRKVLKKEIKKMNLRNYWAQHLIGKAI